MDDDEDKAMPKGAVRLERSLDLAAEMDEPELLMTELRRVAEVYAGGLSEFTAKWRLVAERAHDCLRALEALNAPKDKS